MEAHPPLLAIRVIISDKNDGNDDSVQPSPPEDDVEDLDDNVDDL